MASLQQLKGETSKELIENQDDNMLEQNCDNQMELDNSSIVKDLSHTLVTKIESLLSSPLVKFVPELDQENKECSVESVESFDNCR